MRLVVAVFWRAGPFSHYARLAFLRSLPKAVRREGTYQRQSSRGEKAADGWVTQSVDEKRHGAQCGQLN